MGEFLTCDAGGQRVSPEDFIIEGRAQSALVTVHHGEADNEIAYAKRSQRYDCALQGNDRARAAKGGGIGEIQDASGDRRVGLDQLHQFGNPEIVALQQSDDRQRNALGRGQFARRLQRRVTIRIDKTHGGQSPVSGPS